MDKNVVERVRVVTMLCMDHYLSVRDIAKVTGISKSTVHKDLRDRLPLVCGTSADCVDIILKEHKRLTSSITKDPRYSFPEM